MNFGALNTFPFGGIPYEPVVRAIVYGFCRAVGSARTRVLYKLRLDAQPEAKILGAMGRALVRSFADIEGRADLFGQLGRLDGRLVVGVNGMAEIEHKLYKIRLKVDATAQALLTANIRVYGSEKVNVLAEADVALGEYMVRIRAPLSFEALADMGIDGVIYPRRYIKATADTAGTAFIEVVPRALRRAPVDLSAEAVQSGATGRVAGRLITSQEAVAQIEITDPEVVKRIPWDEPAPDERQFLVNPEPKVFYVVA